MSDTKQRKGEFENFRNPRILTLDQALKLAEEPAATVQLSRQNASKAVVAIHNRVTCRFTGPSNFGQLTFGEKMVWDLTYMQGEVLNGGFHQYLTNSTGETSEAVKVYLREIGALQTLELFQRLSQIFPGGIVPLDRERRCAVVEEWYDKATGKELFRDLDQSFYRQDENLDSLIVDYARKNRSQFSEPSDDIVMKLQRKDRITAHCCGTRATD